MPNRPDGYEWIEEFAPEIDFEENANMRVWNDPKMRDVELELRKIPYKVRVQEMDLGEYMLMCKAMCEKTYLIAKGLRQPESQPYSKQYGRNR